MSAVAPDLPGRELATDSYASAALLAYYLQRPVPNFGIGTAHARQSDIDTDWRAYDGKDILILRGSPPPPEDYQPYFREIKIEKIPLGGGVYHAILGRGFDYSAYRASYLTNIRDRYYRIPAVLPVVRCYFFERYFPR
jgi:hypothetical protein